MTRISEDEYFINIAKQSAIRGTCLRRQVGCVLVDYKGHILSTGFNGNPHGVVHCEDSPCPGANLKSGEGLDKCEAIHAEINAIVHCRDIQAITRCYVTVSPCIYCIKALLATDCKEIIFLEEYAHIKSKDLWEKSNRIWRQYG